MDILLLGPVELCVNGQVFELESDKVRCLIAALALEAGRSIAADKLMDRVWDGGPSRNRAPLHVNVSRARKQIRKAAAAAADQLRTSTGPGPDTAAPGSELPPEILGRAHTYTLETDPQTVDRHRFRRLCDDARTASARGDDERAVELLDTARQLWRGEPLAGLPGLWPAQVRRQLEAEYTSATAARSAAALRLGRFEPLIGELTDLVQRDPVDEQFAGYLMLACYGSRRHSDAMRVFQRLRRALRTDSGNEPDAEISRIYQGVNEGRPVDGLVREFVPGGARSSGGGGISSAGAVPGRRAEDGVTVTERDAAAVADASVRGEPGAAAAAAAYLVGGGPSQSVALSDPAAVGPADIVAEPLPDAARPRMLPRQVALEGRRAELEQLMGVMDTAAGTAATVGTADQGNAARLVAISGMPGVGKTALAVGAAQKISGLYPQGQLYVNLRGHDGSQAPLRSETALGMLLRGLGAPPESVPVGVDECAAMWRAMLASRRCVVVLDDAADAAQVTPLLLGDSASLIIVTSRRYLANLPDAYALALEALPPEDAMALFRRLGGEDRSRDIEEVERIIRLCGYLPLAIKLAAMRFRGRQTWQLSTLTGCLKRGGRLAELRDMETQQGIDRAFSMSYRTLGQAERRAFRQLSLHPGLGFSAEAAAALLDMSQPQAERLLEALLSSSLLQETAPNRHSFHDLLSEYASSLAQAEDSEAERDRAMNRLTSFFIQAADQADRLAYPHRLEPAVPHGVRIGPPPFQPTPDDARAWFETEREALLAVERHARMRGAQDQVALLGQYVASFLEAECHWSEAKEVATASAAYWRRMGEAGALCRSLLSLGAALGRVGDYKAAHSMGDEALALARSIDDRDAEVAALEGLGILHWYLGENSGSLELFETALEITATLGGRRQRRASLENNIAITLLRLEENERAQEYLRHAINGFREAGDVRRLGKALNNAGNLYRKTRNLEPARRCLEEALPILESVGSAYEIAMARMSFGGMLAELGDIAIGISIYRDALRSFEMLGDRRGLIEAWNGLGKLHQASVSYQEAHECHRRALEIAEAIGAAHEQIVAYRGLAIAEFSAGHQETAIEHLRIAIALADRTNEPGERAKSRAVLARVWSGGGEEVPGSGVA